MGIVDHIKHRNDLLESYRLQIAHYRNVSDHAEKLIVLLAEALNNPTPTVLVEVAKAEAEYYQARRHP